MADPKCPSCEAKGLNKIVSQESNEKNGAGDAWFYVVHCSECGHVYGVFAKRVITGSSLPPMSMPKIGF